MSSIFNKFFNFKKNVNSSNSSQAKNTKNSEDFKINIKGQRVMPNIENNNVNLSPSDFEGREKGPPMLNMRTRVKVWGALFAAGLYFYLCYKLIIFRLKSDDLDLMEREVNEEFKLKKKLKDFENKK